MKLICFVFLTLAAFVAVNGQNDNKNTPGSRFQFAYENECGSPLVESQLYDSREGKITEIISGNKVFFEQSINNGNKEKRRFTVQLAGIKTGDNENELKAFLVKNVLNKRIEISGNAKKETDGEFFGILFGAGLGNVNQHLLEKGMAVYADPAYFYGVSRYTLCVYQQVSEKRKRQN